MHIRVMPVMLVAALSLLPVGAAASEIEVRIPSGDVVLAATLRLPDDVSGPLPAIVVVHGSGKATRQQARVLGDRVLGSGFATLTYDKRGTGESTGRYREVNAKSSVEAFDELAGDVVALARWLAARPEVDSSRVGVAGASQAGWIIPLAAEREPRIRFGVVISGPAVSVGREIAYSELAGEDPGSRKGLGDEEIARTMARFDGPEGYDPIPVLERTRLPMIWIQGEKDRSLPMAETLAALERLRTEKGRPVDVHVVPGVNHSLVNVSTGQRVYVWPIADAWLRRTGVLAPRASGATTH